MKRYCILIFLVIGINIHAGTVSISKILNPQNQTQNNEIFKPGDAVFISTFPDTNSFLNRVWPIDDKGYAEFPLVGRVNVVGLSSSELSDFIKKTFKQYLRYPTLYVKPVVRVSLLGGFARPGLYYIDINSSLWEAVLLAGGPVSEDGIYEMRWERENDEKVSDVTPYFEGGISLRAMGFKSGDQIWTPSPNAKTIWDTLREVLPFITTATSFYLLYYNYQRDAVLLNRTRR